MADGKQSLLLTSLRSFYTDMDNCRIFLDVIQAQNRYPSLRILDWLGEASTSLSPSFCFCGQSALHSRRTT